MLIELDLGASYAGHLELELTSDSAGTVDAGWAERIDDGRVVVLQKGSSYVDRLSVVPGRTAWQPYQFNAGRYLAIYLRGFSGQVGLHRVGWQATEPQLPWDQAEFRSGDRQLDRLFEVGARTLRVGTQEALMDCPTRERATYLADGMPTAYWIALTTGDTRHWRHLIREAFARVSAEGLVRSTTFSGRLDTLLDFPLLAVVWCELYLRYTGDLATVRPLLPVARSVVDYFDHRVDERGLFNWRWRGALPEHHWEQEYGDTPLRFGDSLNLFIDHPGMGWHSVGVPGIDRRGINAGINLLRVRALRALGALEDAADHQEAATTRRESADLLADTARSIFHDPSQDLWSDGELDGQRLAQLSQQTNTWALWSGSTGKSEADRLRLARAILKADPESVAQNGPYFWTYLYPELCRLGLTAEALSQTRRRFSVMDDPAVTTLWETWAGDDHDSRCHPWSSSVVQFLLCGIAGLPSGLSQRKDYVITPRPDLLDRVEAATHVRAGRFAIQWHREGASVRLSGTTPAGVTASLTDPRGRALQSVTGHWKAAFDLGVFNDPEG